MTLVNIEHAYLAVNPDHVVSIETDRQNNKVMIRMSDGEIHAVNCEYGKSVFKTQDDIVAMINKAVVK